MEQKRLQTASDGGTGEIGISIDTFMYLGNWVVADKDVIGQTLFSGFVSKICLRHSSQDNRYAVTTSLGHI